MPINQFWSVNLGHGMGPLVLGMPQGQILRILRDEKLDIAIDQDDHGTEVYIDDIETNFVFAEDGQHELRRMDIDDDRLRFGPLEVHGKPVHEIVDLLSVPACETLWCDFYDESLDDQPTKARIPKTDEELLRTGTLWITSLGLGLSLYRGQIETVHLCDSEYAPHFGTGRWTEAQKKLSMAGVGLLEHVPTREKKNLLRNVILGTAIIAFASVVWKAYKLQQQWSQAPDVTAKVTAKDPPPPEPFPDRYTLTYIDTLGTEHNAVILSKDIYGLPEIGDDVPIRYLLEAPDSPLTHVRCSDVGFNYAVPYAIGIFGTYLVLNLILSVLSLFWRNRI